MKKGPKTKAKEKAWAAFSMYIRTRDSLKTTGSLDSCVCVTCPNLYPRTGVGCIQAGHFIAGRGNSILFDERGVHGQCYACNIGRNGAHVEYFVFMEKTYGREVIDELRAERHETLKLRASDFKDIEDKYRELTDRLVKKHS